MNNVTTGSSGMNKQAGIANDGELCEEIATNRLCVIRIKPSFYNRIQKIFVFNSPWVIKNKQRIYLAPTILRLIFRGCFVTVLFAVYLTAGLAACYILYHRYERQ